MRERRHGCGTQIPRGAAIDAQRALTDSSPSMASAHAMATATMTSKGQLTIPKAIRDLQGDLVPHLVEVTKREAAGG